MHIDTKSHTAFRALSGRPDVLSSVKILSVQVPSATRADFALDVVLGVEDNVAATLQVLDPSEP